jgi:hypothetical protein
MENVESAEGSIGRCSMCGRETELIRLPGEQDILCLDCNSDFATADLLIAEIDSATFAGRNANSLVSEFEGIAGRILGRGQSAEREI